MKPGEKEPFRITIHQYNQKTSVEVDHSDIDAGQLIDLLEQALLGAGWGETTVKEIFGHDS